jgi:type I restriction enzyme S subunit
MSDELPRGWNTAPVSEVIEDFQPGFASGEKNVEGGVAHLRMNNIGLDGELVLDLIRTAPENLAKPRHDLLPGDVLVCTTNSGVLVGKCAYFDLKGRYAFSNHLTRLRPKRNVIDGSFLRWNLWLHWKRGVFDDKCKHWVNQSSLPKDALLEDEIVVPPLAEQRRIVAKLEKLLGQVDACQQRLEKLPTLLKRFRQSILAAACSGRLTADWREENPAAGNAADLISKVGETRCKNLEKLRATPAKDRHAALNDFDNIEPALRSDLDLPDIPSTWAWVDLRFVMTPEEPFCYGVVQPGEDDLQGPRLIRICDVQNGQVLKENLRGISPSVHAQYQRSVLRGGEVLVSVVGTIGRPAIAPPDLAGVNIARAVAKIPVREFEARYVLNWLSTSRAENWMVGDAREVARKTLNLEQLRTLPIPLPPLAEQQEIVRRVAGLFALADQLEQRLAQARRQVDKLTPSLLARAFAGQLVPQNPADEPAEKLLERIQQPAM